MSKSFNENPDVLLETAPKAPPAETGVRPRPGARPAWLTVIFCALLIAGIAVLGWLSMSLAAMRIYQVDEASNIFVGRLIATGHSWPGMDLFQVLLSRLMFTGRAVDFYAYARELSLMIFWVNWLLLAMATGERILSARWLVALAGAATLAPLWDFGFEVRHDNLLLAGILLMWGAVRFQPPRLGAYFLAGACLVGLEFVAIKAVLYTLPISAVILAFPPPGARPRRWKLFVAWCVGALVSFLVLRLIFKLVGLGHDYLVGVQNIPAVPSETTRFWPFKVTLSRLLTQTPLLVAASIAAVIACAGTLLRERRAALNWNGILPETMLLGIALTALFVNPNPYPYNLLHVVPYAFLLAFRYGTMLWKQMPRRAGFVPLVVCLVAFIHLLPFGVATQRHWSRTNFRQEELLTLAEDVTDPVKDTVFDGIGFVPTRNVPDIRSFIHGQILKSLINGPGPRIRDLLASNPPPVIIPNYRTDWLPNEDHDFMHERYVSMADDFMVLGNLLPAGGGTFPIYHAGRYRITTTAGSNIIGTYDEPKSFKDALAAPPTEPPLTGTIDGVPLNGHPVELSVGTHRLECPSGQTAAVVWVGPRVDEIARMPGCNHQDLFDNWY
ncbi:MAG TPA: hypothetical protein VG938_18610 [Verrucomicrobiae bacterium]|jgi:hypothetical protein|nr:hypothetical protein [Verrucomicrobiae bacterium]